MTEENLELENPYSVTYPEIIAVASEDSTKIELIEKFDCIGGAMWVQKHYSKSPLVISSKTVKDTNRFIIKCGAEDLNLQGSYFPAGICNARINENDICVSYKGLGGGGVGASICRASAKGILKYTCDESGGGKTAGSTLYLPKYTRVIIGIDDTDTETAGATWTLAHNISNAVQNDKSRYISHTITQLFPVKFRTKNCVAIACEFASLEPEKLLNSFEKLVRKYTLSDDTGLCAYIGFDPSKLMPYAKSVKSGEITKKDFETIKKYLNIRIEGRGIIGAAAAIPYYTKYDEALSL